MMYMHSNNETDKTIDVSRIANTSSFAARQFRSRERNCVGTTRPGPGAARHSTRARCVCVCVYAVSVVGRWRWRWRRSESDRLAAAAAGFSLILAVTARQGQPTNGPGVLPIAAAIHLAPFYACIMFILLILGWLARLGSRVVSVLDAGAERPGFKSQSRRCRVTVVGKLFTPIVPLFTKQRNW